MEKYFSKKDDSSKESRVEQKRPNLRIVLILFFLLVILIIEEVYDICKLCSIEGGGSSRIGSSGVNS